MKNFLISLFFACIFAPVVLAEEPVPSNVTLQLLPGEPNEEEVTIFDQAKTWLEIGAYFNQNYPDAFIEEDGITECDLKEAEEYEKFHKIYDRFYEDIKENLHALYEL